MRKSSSTRPAVEEAAERVRAGLAEDPSVAPRREARPRRRRDRSAGRVRARGRVVAAGRRPASRRAPASLVSTSAPDSSSGCSGSIEPCPVRTATSGARRCPESFAERRVLGCGGRVDRLRRQVPRGLARRTPDPMSTASANARSSPMRKRSASLSPAMNAFELRHRRDRDDAVDASRRSSRTGTSRGSRGRRRGGARARPEAHASGSASTSKRRSSGSSRPASDIGRELTRPLLKPDQGWKRSPSTTLSTTLRSARKAMPTRSSSSSRTAATAARFAASWPVSKRSAV